MLLTYNYYFITLLIAKAKEARIVYYKLLTIHIQLITYGFIRNVITINTFKFKLFYKMSKINYTNYIKSQI